MIEIKRLRRVIHVLRPGATRPEELEIEFDSDALPDTVCSPWLGDGSHTEHLVVRYGNRLRDAFVDEDGHRKGLPFNRAMVGRHSIVPVLGTVVIIVNGGMW